jgi:hypothetical protein
MRSIPVENARIPAVIGRSVVACLAAAVMAGNAQALTEFSFSQGDLSAKVTFEAVGDTLYVTLENTAIADVENPGDVLTGVFFDIDDFAGSLTRETALLTVADASSVLFGTGLGSTSLGYNDYAGAGDIGSEAGYRIGASFEVVGLGDHAIGLVGMDDFLGVDTRFDQVSSHNIQGEESLNGIEYGIVNSGYTGGGNHPIDGPNALIRSGVLFAFSGFSGFGEGDISNVAFNYGTELSPIIPEPSAAVVFSVGLFLVGRHLRIGKRKAL